MQEKNTIYSIFFKIITICCILVCFLEMIRINSSIQNFYGKKTGAKVYVYSIVIPAKAGIQK